MQFIYACELRLADDDDPVVFEKARELSIAWAERRAGPLDLDGLESEYWSADDVMVQSRSLSDPSNALWRLVLEHPGADDEWIWRTTVWLARQPSGITATIRVGVVNTDTRLVEPPLILGRPRLVSELVTALVVRADQRRITTAPWTVGTGQLQELYDLVVQPNRRLPVVVTTPTSAPPYRGAHVTELATQLTGLAHVVYLNSRTVTFGWTERVGRQCSVFGGAVRIYWPGFDPTRPDSSDLWLEGTVARIDARRGFAGMLLERLARTAVLAIPRPPLEARLKSVVDSQRRQRFEALLVEQRSVADDSEWLKEFEAVLDANREFEERIGELETENEGLRSNFAELAKSMATIKPTDSDEPDLPEPRTVAEAIDWIEELAGTRWFRGRVVVETTALDTGRAFRNYRDPAELARAVTTVLEAGVLFHDNKLGTTPMEFFAQRGFGYGAQPSPHLKVDEATGPDQCLRIYWDIDEATRTWRVSSIGRHA